MDKNKQRTKTIKKVNIGESVQIQNMKVHTDNQDFTKLDQQIKWSSCFG